LTTARSAIGQLALERVHIDGEDIHAFPGESEQEIGPVEACYLGRALL
jgi:hypothetical protein